MILTFPFLFHVNCSAYGILLCLIGILYHSRFVRCVCFDLGYQVLKQSTIMKNQTNRKLNRIIKMFHFQAFRFRKLKKKTVYHLLMCHLYTGSVWRGWHNTISTWRWCGWGHCCWTLNYLFNETNISRLFNKTLSIQYSIYLWNYPRGISRT